MSGCATTSISTPPHVPPKLLVCANSPAIPEDTSKSQDVAIYIVNLHDAHADCKSKLSAVRRTLNE